MGKRKTERGLFSSDSESSDDERVSTPRSAESSGSGAELTEVLGMRVKAPSKKGSGKERGPEPAKRKKKKKAGAGKKGAVVKAKNKGKGKAKTKKSVKGKKGKGKQ